MCIRDRASKAATDLIAGNLKSLGIASGYEIVKSETSKALRQWDSAGVRADFVFLDPPYRLRDEYLKTLIGLAESNLVSASTTVIAEHEKRFDPGDVFGRLQRYRRLDQGDAALSFYQLQ